MDRMAVEQLAEIVATQLIDEYATDLAEMDAVRFDGFDLSNAMRRQAQELAQEIASRAMTKVWTLAATASGHVTQCPYCGDVYRTAETHHCQQP